MHNRWVVRIGEDRWASGGAFKFASWRMAYVFSTYADALRETNRWDEETLIIDRSDLEAGVMV